MRNYSWSCYPSDYHQQVAETQDLSKLLELVDKYKGDETADFCVFLRGVDNAIKEAFDMPMRREIKKLLPCLETVPLEKGRFFMCIGNLYCTVREVEE